MTNHDGVVINICISYNLLTRPFDSLCLFTLVCFEADLQHLPIQ